MQHPAPYVATNSVQNGFGELLVCFLQSLEATVSPLAKRKRSSDIMTYSAIAEDKGSFNCSFGCNAGGICGEKGVVALKGSSFCGVVGESTPSGADLRTLS